MGYLSCDLHVCCGLLLLVWLFVQRMPEVSSSCCHIWVKREASQMCVVASEQVLSCRGGEVQWLSISCVALHDCGYLPLFVV